MPLLANLSQIPLKYAPLIPLKNPLFSKCRKTPQKRLSRIPCTGFSRGG